MSDPTTQTDTKKTSDPVRDGALVALAAAEAAGSATAQVATDPGVRAGGAAVAALARIISGIIERHGAEGAAAAKAMLEKLQAEGPKGITDAQLAADDEALLAEIRGWYVPATPPPSPFEPGA